ELTEGWELPIGFVKRPEAMEFEKVKKRYKRGKKRYAYGTPIQLTGEVRNDGERRFVTTEDGTYLRTRDLAIVVKPSELPNIARKNTKWIDISIQRQVLVLYEGKKPIFATMVSTGKDGIGDPETTHSTPRGIFRIRDKHVTATMSSQQLGEEFELTDVPWTQYFQHGYALHAAYWHSEFGRPRSHGCVNLSPLDAYRIFQWTTPELADNWHGVEAGETMGSGTLLYIAP
ncbi:MAG TPA: L,D-transpeptidase, partial [Polyangiaceae bacterium]|nr:L,D-transpeptidase [Polyangiaceae bacterium]